VLEEDAEHDVAHLPRVGAERHRQPDQHSALGIAQGHVAHGLGDEFRVGHDQGGSVAQLNLGGAHADAPHVALGGGEHHPVAHLHRSLGQKDQAG
jgi:hypothetical protein